MLPPRDTPPYLLDKDEHFWATSALQEDPLFNLSTAVIPDQSIYHSTFTNPQDMSIAYHTLFETDASPDDIAAAAGDDAAWLEELDRQSALGAADSGAGDYDDKWYRKTRGAEDREEKVRFVNGPSSVLMHVQRWVERYGRPMNVIMVSFFFFSPLTRAHPAPGNEPPPSDSTNIAAQLCRMGRSPPPQPPHQRWRRLGQRRTGQATRMGLGQSLLLKPERKQS
jgi:hypothetical protein